MNYFFSPTGGKHQKVLDDLLKTYEWPRETIRKPHIQRLAQAYALYKEHLEAKRMFVSFFGEQGLVDDEYLNTIFDKLILETQALEAKQK